MADPTRSPHLVPPERGHGYYLPYAPSQTCWWPLTNHSLQNRKLRHLQGITIRNLTLVSSSGRHRGKTFDDEAIPSTLKSPAKALALRESKKLEHSHSSSDLRFSDGSVSHGNGDFPKKKLQTKPSRPLFSSGLRRRSTLDWSGASPLERQKKLEDATGARMADTFFSLHVTNQEGIVSIDLEPGIC